MTVAEVVNAIGRSYGAKSHTACTLRVAAILGVQQRAVARWCLTNNVDNAAACHVLGLVEAARAHGVQVDIDDLVRVDRTFLAAAR